MNRKWIQEDNKLVREFKFGNFIEAMMFVNKVAKASEESNHHPIIEINYNIVKLTIWTHSARKVRRLFGLIASLPLFFSYSNQGF